MTSRALLQRLLPLACAACSPRGSDTPTAPAPSAATAPSGAATASPPAKPTTTSPATTSPPTASSAAPSASSAPPDTGPPAQRVSCSVGAACVPKSFCATLDAGKPRGFFGIPSTILQCGESGTFTLDRRLTGDGTVCIAKRDKCAPADDAKTAAALHERFRVDQCPAFLPGARPPREVKNGAGQIECCYDGGFGFCEGRPLLVHGRPRVAALAHRPTGW